MARLVGAGIGFRLGGNAAAVRSISRVVMLVMPAAAIFSAATANMPGEVSFSVMWPSSSLKGKLSRPEPLP